jgi:hypothetical protein
MTGNCTTGNEILAITASSVFPARLSVQPRQKKKWAFAMLCSIVWRGLTHIGTHRKVLGLLLRFPPYTEMVFSNPDFPAKYLTPDYLAQGFTVDERASCFLHHYRRLQTALPDSLLRQTLHEDVTIHEISEGANRFALTMGLSRPCNKEGELSLYLRVDGKIVFILSFTIVPGWVVKSRSAETLLVTRLQGVKGAYSQISDATRSLHDVAPSALLFAALQGVADAFGIAEIVAISAAMQSSYSEDCAASFKEAYDDFFGELGIPISATGYFYISVPLQGKPLALIKQGHKLRTKKKRAFKQQIQLACKGFFKKFAPDASRKLLIQP